MYSRDRLKLIKDIYTWCYEQTESFETTIGDGETTIGVDLAYLLGHIANDKEGMKMPFSKGNGDSMAWLAETMPEELRGRAAVFMEITNEAN